MKNGIAKNGIEWFKEKGFTFDDKITMQDVIDLQDDARKDGMMTAQGIASDVIRRESPKYATGKPEEGVNGQNTLSGLAYFVCAAITSEADKLKYLNEKGQP